MLSCPRQAEAGYSTVDQSDTMSDQLVVPPAHSRHCRPERSPPRAGAGQAAEEPVDQHRRLPSPVDCGRGDDSAPPCSGRRTTPSRCRVATEGRRRSAAEDDGHRVRPGHRQVARHRRPHPCRHRPAVTREWKLTASDFDRLNVNGSGISLGHPVGATGGRILATLAHEMHRRQVRYGLETMWIGGGQGLAAVFERVE